MTRWPIKRRWTVATEGTITDAETAGLTRYRGCALLGAAGLGKTFEIEHLAGIDQAAGRDVRKERLADLAQSADVLVSRLDALAVNVTAARPPFTWTHWTRSWCPCGKRVGLWRHGYVERCASREQWSEFHADPPSFRNPSERRWRTCIKPRIPLTPASKL